MAGFLPRKLYRGCHHLDSPHATVCTTAGDFYKIDGTWTDGDNCNYGFQFDGTGKITYIGSSGAYLLFNGTSDLQSNKVCEVTYALYINGVIVPNAQSPVSVSNANADVNISITNFIKPNRGDDIEVYVKSDTNNTTVTTDTLFLTFFGEA